ncbi:unnamed protein product [Ostreobium quekettii]|uniref:FAD-binding domain-containing protein n=1 Tax=Ostreobium quekettii TaxID=121088 RepID=A0A8S1J7Z3_9CHLO|nr:unnamed protein product [Ostreobium quekettii]
MAEAQVEASAGTTGEYKGKTAVVVGAGPSGACAASYLARRGFRVKVFERRGDPEVVPITSHRSIIITLRQETIAAMEALGVEFPPEEDEAGFSGLTRFRGVAWCGEGGIKKDAPLQGRRSILAERFAIARAVLRAVRQEHPMAVQCFFDHQCQVPPWGPLKAIFAVFSFGVSGASGVFSIVDVSCFATSSRRGAVLVWLQVSHK